MRIDQVFGIGSDGHGAKIGLAVAGHDFGAGDTVFPPVAALVGIGYCYANYAPDYDIISIAPGLSTRYERKTHNATIGVDFRL